MLYVTTITSHSTFFPKELPTKIPLQTWSVSWQTKIPISWCFFFSPLSSSREDDIYLFFFSLCQLMSYSIYIHLLYRWCICIHTHIYFWHSLFCIHVKRKFSHEYVNPYFHIECIRQTKIYLSRNNTRDLSFALCFKI